MSESFILLGLVAIVGLLGLMTVAIVAITLGLVRGSFYGWRRQRVSVNTVQAAALPVDYVTQAQLQDLEKRFAANQANVDKRFVAIDGRLGTLESIVANHGAMIATLRQLVDDLRNNLLQLQRTVTANRTYCNLRHAAQIVRNNAINGLIVFISGLIAWLLVGVFGSPFMGWFSAWFIAGPLVTIGVGHLTGWFARWLVDWCRERRQVAA